MNWKLVFILNRLSPIFEEISKGITGGQTFFKLTRFSGYSWEKTKSKSSLEKTV